MTVVKSRALRSVYLVLGVFFLGLAFIGIALPLIPTVGPVLLAAYFFSKSSERFDQWLIENRLFGDIVRDWRAGVGFTVRAKGISIAAIIVTFTISIVFVVDQTIFRAALFALAAALVIYLVQLPTKRPAPSPA